MAAAPAARAAVGAAGAPARACGRPAAARPLAHPPALATGPPHPQLASGAPSRRAQHPHGTRPGSTPPLSAGSGPLDIEFEIKKAKSSGKLDLTECGLTSIPDEVLALDTLRELSLVGNKIAALPEDIGRLASLERLGLAGNQLTRLPEGISELEELQGLWLHGNFIEELPTSFCQLSSLRNCALSGNSLRELPGDVGACTALEHLSVSGNLLTSVPPSIGRLSGLRHLALNGNLLEEIPPEIGGLRMVQELYLQGNNLTEIPGEWTRLKFLKDFSVADNRLGALSLPDPDSLISLITLYIYGNRLEELPAGLAKMPSLQYLWAEGNPLAPGPLGPVVAALSKKLRAVGLDASQAEGLGGGEAGAAEGGAVKVAECWAAGEGGAGGGVAPGYFKLERAEGAAVGGGAPPPPTSPLLVVSFGSAPGVPNWGGLLKRLRRENPDQADKFDLLYVADPGRGWYNGAEQGGGDSYEARIRAAAGRYERVLMLGDSMGATASLLFAPMATRVVAFCPQVDLSTASIRPAKDEGWFAALRERLVGGVASGPAPLVDVHTGNWAHDVAQAGLLQPPSGGDHVRLTVHPVDGHRVALALDKEGELMPIVREAIADELRAAGVGGAGAGPPSAPPEEKTFRAANFL